MQSVHIWLSSSKLCELTSRNWTMRIQGAWLDKTSCFWPSFWACWLNWLTRRKCHGRSFACWRSFQLTMKCSLGSINRSNACQSFKTKEAMKMRQCGPTFSVRAAMEACQQTPSTTLCSCMNALWAGPVVSTVEQKLPKWLQLRNSSRSLLRLWLNSCRCSLNGVD